MYKFFMTMSNSQSVGRTKPGQPALTPMIGSLLRLPHEVVTARILAVLQSKGVDISPTELGVFLYPGPEGRRPAELARQCNMTRQAMNYVLAGLERRGYIERQAGPNSATRVVRMTARGRAMVAPVRNCVAEIELELAAHLGAKRFKALRETLHDLALWLGKLS
jgi:DNA-binding MarR family transcriptional regulator